MVLIEMEEMQARILVTALEDYIESDTASRSGIEKMKPILEVLKNQLGIVD